MHHDDVDTSTPHTVDSRQATMPVALSTTSHAPPSPAWSSPWDAVKNGSPARHARRAILPAASHHSIYVSASRAVAAPSVTREASATPAYHAVSGRHR
mmetsp:Transcript_7716/g.27427  ORF Transcript_7716/g.27427 Transcript_7716/m.27427 type:complete len:98 (+) Transcript_7716:469-762(+)